MKRAQHGKSATRKECNKEKVQNEKKVQHEENMKSERNSEISKQSNTKTLHYGKSAP